MELWRHDAGAPVPAGTVFQQDNASWSARGVVRGFHAQWPAEQGKLISVLAGRIFDVAVDIRPWSPAFGCWVAGLFEAAAGDQLWIPPGFAHGFQALDDQTLVMYKVTTVYTPADELTVRWDDPALEVPWPLAPALVSPRDAAAVPLAALTHDRLPARPAAGTLP